MKRFHWQLFALSTLSFSVSTENFGFTVSTPFFFLKNLFLNSKMHVNHSLVAVTQQKFYSAAVQRTKQLFFFCLRKGKLPKRQAWYVISKGADVFTGIMSIHPLAVISFERMFAVGCPLCLLSKFYSLYDWRVIWL